MSDTALILGPRGRFARHAAAALAVRGWQLRRFDRSRDSLSDAVSGAALIVNGWNPPYDRWAAELPGLTRQVIAAARDSGATILQPANVYVFGTDAPPVLGADTLHRASNPLGRLRIAMEASLRDSGAPVILLRAGDFLDDAPSGGWFDKVIAAPIAKGHIRYPGAPDVPHAWAYLPDLGRAAAQLAGRRATLERFEEVPFAGYTLTGRELAAALSRVTGREIALRSMAWWPLHLARPFWGMAAGLLEMRYLWAMEHRLDAARLRALLPDFADTPPETALASALQRDVDPDEAVA